MSYTVDHSHPRRALFAALMSSVLPGFGQLYNGQVNRAIWFYLAICLLVVPGAAVIALTLPGVWMALTLAIGLVATVSLWAYGIADAWITARRRARYQLQAWQTSGLYAVVFIGCSLVQLPLLTDWIRNHQVQAFKIPSGSMSPTVVPGDFLFADMRYNCPGCRTSVRRGDVAVFVDPNDRNRIYIKRILGLPGDRVAISGKAITINGKPLSSDVATTAPSNVRANDDQSAIRAEQIDGRSWRVQWQAALPDDYAITVSNGHVFVLGDNRDSSVDSRQFGLVPLIDVRGLARNIWFSHGAQGIRWSRIGTAVGPD